MSDKLFIKGTLILTLTGLVSRLMGFFYRIFLSHTIGAQGVGIYQLTLPVHAIVLAACCMGIQAAISRLCASFTALGKEKESRDALLLGTFLSMALCGLLSFLVYWNADFVASALLKEPRTAVLLRILAFSFPFSALHSCVNSFYYARKTTGIPAFILLLEQTSRIGSTYVIYLILISQKKEITPVIAAGGALFSELTATAACMLALGLDFSRENYKPGTGLLRRILRVFFCMSKGAHRNSPSAVKYISHIQPASVKNNTATSINALIKGIAQIAVPHSVNRLLLTLLSGIEMVLIPQRLLLAGINRTDSLSVYGIFTGMALPLILFPATLTNSASVMLMPSVAGLQALGHEKKIRHVIRRTCENCFFFGGFCTFFFFIFGKSLGNFLFHSETAGIYIRTLAFICPFLYTNTALESILNGLGRPDACLFHNIAGVCIRIGFVFFSIPVLGIRGYFYGMLLSQLVLTLLHFIYLNRLEHV